MSAEDAFIEALAAERGYGGESNFRLALESVGGSTRTLADELGVSQRTVQRWAAYESGSGAQARNPSNSPQAGELKVMADVEKDARTQTALDRMADYDSFDADIELEYVASGDARDDGDRRAYPAVAPLNMRPAVDAFRNGGDFGARLSDAIAESYGVPASDTVTNVSSLNLH
jgi:hypothetical protein